MMKCVFCNLKNSKEVVFENELAFAIKDNDPACLGHILVIPKRHSENYFELTKEEIGAMLELSNLVKDYLDQEYHPDGYNVGFNVKETGGQTVMHTHMHILPRYENDVSNPRGGIRKVVKM